MQRNPEFTSLGAQSAGHDPIASLGAVLWGFLRQALTVRDSLEDLHGLAKRRNSAS